MSDGLHARIAESERVMALEIGEAMTVRSAEESASMARFSDSVTAAMQKRAGAVAAAIEESDEALRKITALYHGVEPTMPDGSAATAALAGGGDAGGEGVNGG